MLLVTEIRLLQAKSDEEMNEFSFIGATGEAFVHAGELHEMNYKQAMLSKDAAEWQAEVNKEHD